MDPIGASCFSLHVGENEQAIREQKKQDEKFSEIIVSCKSLSKYEGRTFRSLLPQILATAVAGSYHVVVGISLAYSAILLPKLMETKEIEITESQASWIASIIVVVVPVGAIFGGFLMDTVGRLNTVKLAAIPGAIGWTLIATATNVPMLLAGRLLTGLASTWGSSPATVYITEIARADMRGSLISCAPAYASLGMVIAYLKGWVLDWRMVAWMCNAYSLIPCLLIMFIPESPVWLVSKGRNEEASKSLEWINKYQPQPANRNESLAELQLRQLQKENQEKLEEQARRGGDSTMGKFREFLKPTAYKPLVILFGLFFFQQFSGIYITLFYSVNFFKEVGTTINPYLASVLIGTVRFSMSMINTYMLKTFRRRPLVMTSCVGMTLCMALSGLFTGWIKSGTVTQTWVPVLLLLLYVITSMIGLLPIPWTMTAELFPIEIRGVAHSIAYSIANLLMFASVQSYFTLNQAFGGVAGVQYFFACIAICGAVYAYVFLPETHGKKLTDITDYFNHNLCFIGQKAASTASNKKTSSRVAKKDIVLSKPDDNDKLMQNV